MGSADASGRGVRYPSQPTKNLQSNYKDMRKCTKCGIDKKEEFFGINKGRNGHSYRRNTCIECIKIYQRVNRREYRKNRYERLKDHYTYLSKEYRKKHPEKRMANIIYMNAVGSGKIKKKNCEYPNGKCEGQVQAHHWDYKKPLEVTFLCRKHHILADNVRRLKEKYLLKT